jgi:hypothetical protein
MKTSEIVHGINAFVIEIVHTISFTGGMHMAGSHVSAQKSQPRAFFDY